MTQALRQGVRLAGCVVAALLVAQCATPEDDRFHVGASESALVIIGVAEAYDAREASYAMLWRRLDEAGAFTDPNGGRSFEARTNGDHTIRIPGIPGEFTVMRVDPGRYALDSVFAVIRDRRVNYIAQGMITEAPRPAFDVAAGDAVFLGIWEARIEGHLAAIRPWRLDRADLRELRRAEDFAVGDIRTLETFIVSVPCAPRRLSNLSQRQIC